MTLRDMVKEKNATTEAQNVVTLPSGRKVTVRPSVAKSLEKSLEENARLWTKLSKR